MSTLRHTLAGHLRELLTFFDEDRVSLLAEAQTRQLTLPQLLAAALTESLLERFCVTPQPTALASLFILCCNQLDYTRQCLDSVLRCTRAPYELILVNNGSTDGTAEYLEEVRQRPGPRRVVVIHNEQNLGFARGNNQALAQAAGDFLVLLNNDTVVTEHWLEGLIRWAVFDWPHNGLVGPVTNCSTAPQEIPATYHSPEELAAFAQQRRQEYAGQGLRVERLPGFCLLIRRDVWEQIGDLDERFGLGFFEDDDWGVRARRAGFRLLVAQEVFIHHFGSRTFAGLGIDTRQQLQDNFALFGQKWGQEYTAGYRLPGAERANVMSAAAGGVADADAKPQAAPANAVPVPAAVVVQAAPVVTFPEEFAGVSLCIIAKNEEQVLPGCLESVRALIADGTFQEVIVLDTGSTDRTKEIAREFGARVCDFVWVDDFAAARNACLEQATGAWIFWLDCDDRLDPENCERLRQLLRNVRDENAAYVMKCRCLPDPHSGLSTEVDHVRLFRNHPQVRWTFRVHEQILPAARSLGADLRWSGVVITHTGYVDSELRARKLDRDLRLLLLEEQEQPDNAFTLFNLGSVYRERGQVAQAVPLLTRSLRLSQPTDSIVRKLYVLLTQTHRQEGHLETARAWLREGRDLFPNDVELLFQQGKLLKTTGDDAGAEQSWLAVLATAPDQHFGCVEVEVRGLLPHVNLALLYEEQQRWAEAYPHWYAIVQEQPHHAGALLGCAEYHRRQQQWEALDTYLQTLESLPGLQMNAAVLRAQVLLAGEDFPAARQLLEQTQEAYPEALWPKVVYSHALLQEGRDLAAAERVLRDVLVQVPDHRESRHNLALLLRTLGRIEEAQQVRQGGSSTAA